MTVEMIERTRADELAHEVHVLHFADHPKVPLQECPFAVCDALANYAMPHRETRPARLECSPCCPCCQRSPVQHTGGQE